MTEQTLVSRPERWAEAVEYARQLDPRPVHRMLVAPDGRFRWPRYRANEVELEWRRWRLRRWLGDPEEPPASIRQFERLGVAAGLEPSTARGPDDAARDIDYDLLFPQGPLVVRAQLHGGSARSVGAPAVAVRDPLLEAGRRRRDYLATLPRDAFLFDVPELVSPGVADRCADEAAAVRSTAATAFGGGRETGWDVQQDTLISCARNALVPDAGPALGAVHEDTDLVGVLSRKMGRPMFPTRSSYLYYEDGDYLGVHTDMPTCEIALFFTVSGPAGPLRVHPRETDAEPEWLHGWLREQGDFPEGGEDHVYEPRQGLAILGRAIPHGRPVHRGPDTTIACLFYSGL